MIETSGEELIADFQQTYGMNFARAVREEPPSRLLMLIRQLPLESRTIARLRGGEQFIGWGVDRYMMAQLIDSVNSVAHISASANSKKKLKAPKPMTRPKKKAPKADNVFRQRMDAAKKAKGVQ